MKPDGIAIRTHRYFFMISSRRPKNPVNRNKILLIFQFVVLAIIMSRLFYLQIIKGNYYQTVAAKEHSGYTELPARRGEIFIKDYHSNELFRIATNTTLDLLYADPTLIKNPQTIVEKIGPLIFDLKEAREKENERIEKLKKSIPEKKESDAEINSEIKNENIENAPEQKITPRSDQELQETFKIELLQKITSLTRQKILLGTDFDEKTLEKIKSKGLVGVEIQERAIYVYPPQITNIDYTTKMLAELLDIPSGQLAKTITAKNRYVILKRKIPPEKSTEIKKFLKKDKEAIFSGIGLREEYHRFYPEGALGGNVIGYVNTTGSGIYGIEGKFNTQLKGKNGIFQTQKDSIGRQITVGQSVIQPAVNGDDVVLTIDRSIQTKTDHLLERTVKDTRADNGQIIILEIKTGRILAMSHYPSFDPNNYSEVFEREIINLTKEEEERIKLIDEKTGEYSLILNDETGEQLRVFKETEPRSGGKAIYKKYKNRIGPEAYQNKLIAWEYEPGSVFKTIAMATAIDDKDVTPQTIYHDTGPVKTDEYEIKNATGQYFGAITMKTVLEKSLNTGMTFVARKIGRNLFYNYIKKFGFGERSDIEFDDEATGKIKPYTQWAESELITYTFGQGLTVTPLQMANSYAAIANNGLLMQPYIVEEIRQKNGRIIKNEPHPMQQVINPETANIMKVMLVSATENGVARHAQVAGHYVGAKTGTAQTYYKGKPIKGIGTTITNVVGFGPVDEPKFVILVKLDRPRQSEWADATAAPLFSKIAGFLFDYFNIPPDKKTAITGGTIGRE